MKCQQYQPKYQKKNLMQLLNMLNACGETVSNLIRKAIIKDVTFLDGFDDSKDYNYGFLYLIMPHLNKKPRLSKAVLTSVE